MIFYSNSPHRPPIVITVNRHNGNFTQADDESENTGISFFYNFFIFFLDILINNFIFFSRYFHKNVHNFFFFINCHNRNFTKADNESRNTKILEYCPSFHIFKKKT